MYKAYEFTSVSLQTSDGTVIPLSAENMHIEMAETHVDYVWEWPALRDFTIELDLRKVRRVPLLRLFYAGRASISRRKVWRYMEYKGL